MGRKGFRRLSLASSGLAAGVLAFGLRAAAADLVNVAPVGTATQSSQLGAFGPELAIDGNYANFTHTLNTDDNATWEDDLGQEFAISKIVLYNRTDCCGSRLRDITVYILDPAGDIVWESELLNPENELGAFPNGPPQLELDLVALEGGFVTGQIVRVRRTPDPDYSGGGDGSNLDEATVLSLAEAEILVDRSLLPVSILTQPQGGRAYVGRCHVFSIALFNAESAGSISYQWFKDDVKIPGATGSRLILSDIQPSDAGTYRVEVTVDGKLLKSDPAELVVPGRNLALTGTATQVNTAFGGAPERAIDGNTSPYWADASLTHTDNTPGAWWQVELYGESTVETVVLWNRKDCCSERLSNFRISALDEGGDEVWGEDYFTDLTYPETSFEVDLGGVECRTIRVARLGPDLNGLNYLSLAEVEVFGEGPLPPAERRPNLARGCGVTTRQSSQLGAFGSELAADGVYTNFTHTLNTDENATWELDLQAEYDLALVVLYNRTDCCGSRLRDVRVSILDGAGDPVWESDLLNPENELGAFPLGPPQLSVNLIELAGKAVKGQVVRVHRTPDLDLSGTGGQGNVDEATVLSLAEVEVFALPSDCPAAGDTHCDGLAVEGPADSYPGLYTVTASARDESGDPILYRFTLDDGVNPPIVLGPQEANFVRWYLGSGTWTISVAVDDDLVCLDQAADATCSEIVQVIEIENLAASGLARQSSDYIPGMFLAAEGNDGNYGNFTHTAIGNNGLGPPTWEVDLLDEYLIGRIVLYNRTDCCGSRLRDVTVYILDGAGDLVWQSELLNLENELGEYPWGPPTLTVDLEREEGAGILGQIVRVERLPDPDLSGTGGQGNEGEPDVLSLAEVEVFPARGVVPKPSFRRGDSNDDGSVNITDGIYILNYLFLGGPTPTCLEAADGNDDGGVNITDGIYILNYLFLGGPEPPAPGSFDCGPDPAGSPPEPGCERYTSC